MRRRLVLCLLSTVALSPAVLAQTPREALAARWTTICTTAVNGTLLFERCSETTSPLAILIAATGQRLEEIPGQARIATRDLSRSLTSPATQAPDSAVAVSVTPRFDGGMNLQLDGQLAPDWSLFFSGDLGRVSRRAGQNEAAFDANTGSLTAGANWQPRPGWLFGLALNQVRESLDFRESDGSADTRFSGLIATASHPLGETWSVDGYAGVQRGRYALRRQIHYTIGPVTIDGTALADPAAERRISGAALAGNWSRGAWERSLALGLDNARTQIDAYAETGGLGLALRVPQRDIETRRGRVDFGLGRAISRRWGVWQPSLRLSWFREFSNARRPVGLILVQDPRQNVIRFDTEDADPGWGEVAFGSVFVLRGGHSGFVQAQQRVGHRFLQERMLSLGWRMEL